MSRAATRTSVVAMVVALARVCRFLYTCMARKPPKANATNPRMNRRERLIEPPYKKLLPEQTCVTKRKRTPRSSEALLRARGSLSDRARDLRKYGSRVGSDQAYCANHDDQDHSEHDSIFGDILSLFVIPKPVQRHHSGRLLSKVAARFLHSSGGGVPLPGARPAPTLSW